MTDEELAKALRDKMQPAAMDEAMAMYQALVNPPAPDNVIASSNN